MVAEGGTGGLQLLKMELGEGAGPWNSVSGSISHPLFLVEGGDGVPSPFLPKEPPTSRRRPALLAPLGAWLAGASGGAAGRRLVLAGVPWQIFEVSNQKLSAQKPERPLSIGVLFGWCW